MTDSPADQLTAAAQLLRDHATADYVTPGSWIVHEANGFLRVDNDRDKTREAWTVKTGADLAEENRPTAEYIALMHPGVGLAVADWLNGEAARQLANEKSARHVWRNSADTAARDRWIADHIDQHALAVARALLGEVTE